LGSKKLKELLKKRPGSNRGFWICFCHGVTSLCSKLHIVLFLGVAYVLPYSAIWVWWWRPRDFTLFFEFSDVAKLTIDHKKV
jgi:hypothetical protein